MSPSSSSHPHVIGRTVVELDAGAMADVWTLQEDVSQLVQEQVLPQLEGLFDRLCPEDETIRLDRVVLDVGAIALHDLPQEWVPRVVQQLEDRLRDLVGGASSGEVDEVPPVQLRGPEAAWEVLQVFLQYGRFPWWHEREWVATVETWRQALVQPSRYWSRQVRSLLRDSAVARQRLVMQLPEDIQTAVILAVQPQWSDWPEMRSQSVQFLESLDIGEGDRRYLQSTAVTLLLETLRQTPDSSALPVQHWLNAWVPEAIAVVRAEITSVSSSASMAQPLTSTGDRSTAASPQTRNEQHLRQRLQQAIASLPKTTQSLWKSVVARAVSLESDAPAETDLALRRRSLSPSDDLSPTQSTTPTIDAPSSVIAPNQPASPQSSDRSPSPDPAVTVEQSNDSNQLRSIRASQDLPSTQPAATDAAIVAAALNPSGNTDTPSPTSLTLSISPDEERAGIFAPNTGLVLLHPFLKSYFAEVGLLEGDRFKDSTAHQTAIYLLHWLATADPTGPEVTLTVPKLLCNWPLNQPLSPVPLPAAALTEGDHLLEVIIQRWTALKNTSPDGLRQGFLQRTGKLTCPNGTDWTLQVEQSALDILLNRLPWGTSMVKLPWMDCLLTVEWT